MCVTHNASRISVIFMNGKHIILTIFTKMFCLIKALNLLGIITYTKLDETSTNDNCWVKWKLLCKKCISVLIKMYRSVV